MKLIGMLDSPYVRRVAISLQLLGLKFEHQPLSVFRTFAEFRQINPVVKAPTLICDDGVVLMDSTLILDYAEALAAPRSLLPSDIKALQLDLRLIGLALAACEKSVQIVYEGLLRPEEKRHDPWLNRVRDQMRSSYILLEQEIASKPRPAGSHEIDQAGLTVAVAWHFTQRMIPDEAPGDRFPNLVAYSAAAEALDEFRAAPFGDGRYKGHE